MDAQESDFIMRSPLPKIHIPEVPLVEFAFETHKNFTRQQLDKPWIVNVPSGKQLTFGQAKHNARKIASALSRLGFTKGDYLYFLTTECVDLYQLQLAVWMLGGAVRGSSVAESTESYIYQMKEVEAKFYCLDVGTEKILKDAAMTLDHWDFIYVCIGEQPVKGAIHLCEMLLDDGNAFPENLHIDVHNDIMMIANTSGSTGLPKGVMHTNYTYTANLIMMEHLDLPESIMEFANNYGVVNTCLTMLALRHNKTVYHLNELDKSDFMHLLLKFKPRALMLYPYIATWFARHPLLEEVREQDFMKHILIGGWVLDPTTALLLSKCLPNTHIQQEFGMSEVLFATATEKPRSGIAKIPFMEKDGQIYTSSGTLFANVEAKVLSWQTKAVHSPLEEGEIFIRSPTTMKGYLRPGRGINRDEIDSDGWLTTGDIGFFDKAGNLYIKERANFMFRYLHHYVSPSEIESTLQEHPAVLAAGVVGLLNPETNNLARALVVLRESHNCSEDELCEFVKSKLPYYKHLHGGVAFVSRLPSNKGGKIDRRALKEMAVAQLKK